MIDMTIVDALYSLGFTSGYACNDELGILVWDNEEPQPTEQELIAAGWIKLIPTEN